jgi:hypothetical protein
MSKHTHVKAQNTQGSSLQVTQHESDSPVLPISQLKELHDFRPDLVDWVCQQPENEALARRKRTHRVDSFILIERLSGLFCGTLLSMIGLGIAAYLAIHDQSIVAGVIGSTTLIGLVTVLVRGHHSTESSK